MAVVNVIRRSVDLNDPGVILVHVGRLFAEGDSSAHTFEIHVNASGKKLDLTGASITGYFVREDDNTVFLKGSCSGNVATLTLAPSCYTLVGAFKLIIRASLGEYKTSIFWCDGTISNTITDTVIDPGNEVPNIDEVIEKFKELESKITEAEAATQAANDAAAKATEQSTKIEGMIEESQQVLESAEQAVQDVSTLTKKFENVTATMETLPANSDPSVNVTQTEDTTSFNFGLPKSDVKYSTFHVDNEMNLMMESPDNFDEFTFALKDDGKLYLEVKE